ncbi:hypothetical protein [Cellulomonas palmilytica]|uniref:hypothetical protein n=1 Tax=Cellulomonas palmilytica TaxID=2608402 RepID=UPI001F335AE8|nr:hypothetical protein [Cellulomonas palmilytica]UJP40405.1 hypothetical protein F1D97_02425 [Cellulomonas palmilytica]
MNWLEVVGWIGSVLVVVSLMQARVLRFRVLNLAGAAIATVYNVVIDVWPFAAMNGAIAVIDVYWLWRLLRERHDEAAYEVVEVAPDDAYLARVLDVHAADIARFAPTPVERPTSAAGPTGTGTTSAFLVVRGDETVGVVQLRDEGERTARVLLDYVTPRFRDFTPGEFVYRRSGVFTERGFDRLVVEPVATNQDYFRRVGFAPADDGTWTRAVVAA